MTVDLEEITFFSEAAKMIECTSPQAQALIQYLDLTSLNDNDTTESVQQLCTQASTDYGDVAAVCIYPQFIPIAKESVTVPIATVCNFPQGNSTQQYVIQEIESALAAGADEIDMVIPYQDYVAGNTTSTVSLVRAAKACCGDDILLKVILEVGALIEPNVIYQASVTAIQAGADFIKTSTGKINSGASIPATVAMLSAIRDTPERRIGYKAAGGIRDLNNAAAYVMVAEKMLGSDWLSPQHFRLGTSKLLNAILQCLDSC